MLLISECDCLRGGKRVPTLSVFEWVPFLNRNAHLRASPLVTRSRALTTRTAHPSPPPPRLTSPPLSTIASLLAADTIAFESEATEQWNLCLMDNTVLGVADLVASEGSRVPGFVRKNQQCSAFGPRAQNRQLMMNLPPAHMGMGNDATLRVARAIQLSDRRSQVPCKLFNRGKTRLRPSWKTRCTYNRR